MTSCLFVFFFHDLPVSRTVDDGSIATAREWVALWIKVVAKYVCKCGTSGSDLALVQVSNHCILMSSREPHANISLKSSCYWRSEMYALLSGNVRVTAASWLVFFGRAWYICQDMTHLYPHLDLWAICELLPHYLVLHISLFKQWLRNGEGVVSSIIITLQACVFRGINPTQTIQPCTTALSVSTCSIPQA